MRRGILTLLGLMAALATVGGAARGLDDCASAGGGAAALCLLDDHCYGWPVYHWCTNRPAQADAALGAPGATVAAAGHAEQYDYYNNAFFVQTVYQRTSAAGGVSAGTAAGGDAAVGASALQDHTTLGYEPHTASSHRTQAGLGASAAGHGASAAFAQKGSYSAPCRDRAAVALDGALLAAIDQPCTHEVPQAMKTCAPLPPSVTRFTGPVCGKFPDWPDTGMLPFL